MSAQNEKIALFIDGANLYTTAKSLGLDIDYKRLLREFQSGGHLLRAFYYTAVFDDQESVSIRPLIDWLEYNGYTVVTKAAKELVDHSGRRKVKGNMDIELAVDAMEIAPHIDRMVLFSGDGDFRSLVQAVQRRGVRVVVVSSMSTQPPMVAQELRRQADEFIDLKALQNKISRDPVQRPPRDRAASQSLQRTTGAQIKSEEHEFDED
jgi:uncharacterized LabA/DUF88 family protein